MVTLDKEVNKELKEAKITVYPVKNSTYTMLKKEEKNNTRIMYIHNEFFNNSREKKRDIEYIKNLLSGEVSNRKEYETKENPRQI